MLRLPVFGLLLAADWCVHMSPPNPLRRRIMALRIAGKGPWELGGVAVGSGSVGIGGKDLGRLVRSFDCCGAGAGYLCAWRDPGSPAA